MLIKLNKNKILAGLIVFLAFAIGTVIAFFFVSAQQTQEKSYIKWFEFNAGEKALADAMALDIETYDMLYHISWIDTLSYLACKNGNDFSRYKSSDISEMKEKLGDIYTVDDLMKDNKYYSFYKEAFGATLGGLLGEYEKQAPDGKGGKPAKGKDKPSGKRDSHKEERRERTPKHPTKGGGKSRPHADSTKRKSR